MTSPIQVAYLPMSYISKCSQGKYSNSTPDIAPNTKYVYIYLPAHQGISQVKKYVCIRRINFQKTSFLDIDINARPIF